jgi:hypothetical protein
VSRVKCSPETFAPKIKGTSLGTEVPYISGNKWKRDAASSRPCSVPLYLTGSISTETTQLV